MAWIRTKWKPEDAEEWTREDLIACILSTLSYLGLTVGVALSLLLNPVGYFLLGATVVVTWVLYAVLDPKLRTISEEYESKQRHHLAELEKIQRWED